MSALIKRIRASRETWTTYGGHEFLIRRPTQYQVAQMVSGPSREVDDRVMVRQAVVDWRGVLDSDLAPGGTADPVPFDSDVLIEFAEDRPGLWNHLVSEILRLVREYQVRNQAAEKKLTAALLAAREAEALGRESRGNGSAWSAPANIEQAAILAWNWMGGEIHWPAFEAIADVLGVDDVELLIRAVVSIRESMRA